MGRNKKTSSLSRLGTRIGKAVSRQAEGRLRARAERLAARLVVGMSLEPLEDRCLLSLAPLNVGSISDAVILAKEIQNAPTPSTIALMHQSENMITSSQSITNAQKQSTMLTIVNTYRGNLPAELVLAEIFQEGGLGAFYVDGYDYNSFYSVAGAPWAQPDNNTDGIMQVTSSSGHHQASGAYTDDQVGYEHAIDDGSTYLNAIYDQYGTPWQGVLHYNTGPSSLYIYLGLSEGTRNYLGDVASDLQNLVPPMFALSNSTLVNELNQAQTIVNSYLNNSNILHAQSASY